jgi:hypothetical protein
MKKNNCKIFDKFIKEIKKIGLEVKDYKGRFFYSGRIWKIWFYCISKN